MLIDFLEESQPFRQRIPAAEHVSTKGDTTSPRESSESWPALPTTAHVFQTPIIWLVSGRKDERIERTVSAGPALWIFLRNCKDATSAWHPGAFVSTVYVETLKAAGCKHVRTRQEGSHSYARAGRMFSFASGPVESTVTLLDSSIVACSILVHTGSRTRTSLTGASPSPNV
eukprot:scaffold4277_cov405-Prasinococcus_capsulatus_cf.AAC.10